MAASKKKSGRTTSTKKKIAKKSTAKKKSAVKRAAKSSAPKKSGALGPYTPVVRAGDWVIVSGQLGVVDGKVVAGGVAKQTAQAVVNLKAQLATAGVTNNDVKKTL
jgi:2-iminobutanoate/2-iminopropanoate deaminase